MSRPETFGMTLVFLVSKYKDYRHLRNKMEIFGPPCYTKVVTRHNILCPAPGASWVCSVWLPLVPSTDGGWKHRKLKTALNIKSQSNQTTV